MYKRGYLAGGNDSSRVICMALDDAGVMKPQRLLQHVENYWNKISKGQGE